VWRDVHSQAHEHARLPYDWARCDRGDSVTEGNRCRRQWRWFVSPETGRRIAREEYEALPVHGQAALASAIGRRGHGASLPGEVKPLVGRKGLFELTVQVGYDPFRALFFVDSPVHDICVLVAYKNQRRLPKSDLDLAVRRMGQWKAAAR